VLIQNYMMAADGRAYSVAGVGGTLVADAAIGVATYLLAGILLARFDSKSSSLAVESRGLAPAMRHLKGDL